MSFTFGELGFGNLFFGKLTFGKLSLIPVFLIYRKKEQWWSFGKQWSWAGKRNFRVKNTESCAINWCEIRLKLRKKLRKNMIFGAKICSQSSLLSSLVISSAFQLIIRWNFNESKVTFWRWGVKITDIFENTRSISAHAISRMQFEFQWLLRRWTCLKEFPIKKSANSFKISKSGFFETSNSHFNRSCFIKEQNSSATNFSDLTNSASRCKVWDILPIFFPAKWASKFGKVVKTVVYICKNRLLNL